MHESPWLRVLVHLDCIINLYEPMLTLSNGKKGLGSVKEWTAHLLGPVLFFHSHSSFQQQKKTTEFINNLLYAEPPVRYRNLTS